MTIKEIYFNFLPYSGSGSLYLHTGLSNSISDRSNCSKVLLISNKHLPPCDVHLPIELLLFKDSETFTLHHCYPVGPNLIGLTFFEPVVPRSLTLLVVAPQKHSHLLSERKAPLRCHETRILPPFPSVSSIVMPVTLRVSFRVAWCPVQHTSSSRHLACFWYKLSFDPYMILFLKIVFPVPGSILLVDENASSPQSKHWPDCFLKWLLKLKAYLQPCPALARWAHTPGNDYHIKIFFLLRKGFLAVASLSI